MPAALVHPHVQRRVLGVGEAAVRPRRAAARRRRGRTARPGPAPTPEAARARRRARRRPRARGWRGRRTAPAARPASASACGSRSRPTSRSGAEPLEQRLAVPAEAEGGVDDDRAGCVEGRGEQVEGAGEQDRDVRRGRGRSVTVSLPSRAVSRSSSDGEAAHQAEGAAQQEGAVPDLGGEQARGRRSSVRRSLGACVRVHLDPSWNVRRRGARACVGWCVVRCGRAPGLQPLQGGSRALAPGKGRQDAAERVETSPHDGRVETLAVRPAQISPGSTSSDSSANGALLLGEVGGPRPRRPRPRRGCRRR